MSQPTGVSALWWALNPPRGKAISESMVRMLIATNRVDPTQTWYGQKMVYACREDNITKLLETYEANYVQQRNNWGNGAGRLAAMAADAQNTHDPLVVKQYDTYITALYNRYLPKTLAWQKSFDEFVREVGYDQNPSFTRAIKRIKGMDTTRPLLDKDVSLSNAELVMLVWHALNDENKAHFVAGDAFSEEDRNESKRQLLDAILDAQHEYAPNSPACFMGTRHYIIRALDKKHVDCLENHQAFTEAHVEDMYDVFCESAISDLAKTDAQCYGLYFESLFSIEDEPLVNQWVQNTKEQFWQRVEERQKQTIPAKRLSPEVFHRLKEMYQYEDTLLSLRNHPVFALTGR